MLGGYQILDLRNIGLTLGSSQVSITDAEILNQLRNLRNYIEKGHDYGKALDNSPKPVLIRYRDAKNNEKLEVSAFASVTSSNNSLTYDIRAKGLEIEVVFEEKTDDDGNKYYDIKTAKYKYSENESVEGDLSVTGDAKIFENIVDKDGHKRFIDGDIDIQTSNLPEGMTVAYAKWTLSGTHLVCVIAGSVSANVETPIFPTRLAYINLPEWIMDKIYPISNNWLESVNIYLYPVQSSAPSNQVIRLSCFYNKTNNRLEIVFDSASITALYDSGFRYCIDLVIDNEDQV